MGVGLAMAVLAVVMAFLRVSGPWSMDMRVMCVGSVCRSKVDETMSNMGMAV